MRNEVLELKAAMQSVNNAQLYLINSRSENTPYFQGSDDEHVAYVAACGLLHQAKMALKGEITNLW